MDDTGQIYFDFEDLIPQEDKDRLLVAEKELEASKRLEWTEEFRKALDEMTARRYADGS